jgi:hypothetical protein
MKDITKRALGEDYTEIIISKTKKADFERILQFTDVQDVLDNYFALNKNIFDNSIQNKINFNIINLRKKNKYYAEHEMYQSTIRQEAHDYFKPVLPSVIGQLSDVRLAFESHHPTAHYSITKIKIYDNIFNSVEGMIINNLRNNYDNTELINELSTNHRLDQVYNIGFLGLPTMHYVNGTLCVSPESLLLLKIEKEKYY